MILRPHKSPLSLPPSDSLPPLSLSLCLSLGIISALSLSLWLFLLLCSVFWFSLCIFLFVSLCHLLCLHLCFSFSYSLAASRSACLSVSVCLLFLTISKPILWMMCLMPRYFARAQGLRVHPRQSQQRAHCHGGLRWGTVGLLWGAQEPPAAQKVLKDPPSIPLLSPGPASAPTFQNQKEWLPHILLTSVMLWGGLLYWLYHCPLSSPSTTFCPITMWL